MASESGVKGVLHQYTSKLTAFEHTPSALSSLTLTPPTNTLVFIGGLGDGFLTVPYTPTLSQALPSSWSLIQPLLSSSYNGFGSSSLQKDVEELNKCVKYLREKCGRSGKLVLMGHSTGCQDIMEFLTGKGKDEREKVDGVVLQAGVSDREAITSIGLDEELEESIEKVRNLLKDGTPPTDILPSELTSPFYSSTPLTASRFLSLVTKNGDDDYFSSDLSDSDLQKSFGALPRDVGLLVLLGSDDEYMGEDTDRKALVDRWCGFAKIAGAKVDEGCGVVEGATHNLKGCDDEVVQDLVGRVKGYLERL